MTNFTLLFFIKHHNLTINKFNDFTSSIKEFLENQGAWVQSSHLLYQSMISSSRWILYKVSNNSHIPYQNLSSSLSLFNISQAFGWSFLSLLSTSTIYKLPRMLNSLGRSFASSLSPSLSLTVLLPLSLDIFIF